MKPNVIRNGCHAQHDLRGSVFQDGVIDKAAFCLPHQYIDHGCSDTKPQDAFHFSCSGFIVRQERDKHEAECDAVDGHQDGNRAARWYGEHKDKRRSSE